MQTESSQKTTTRGNREAKRILRAISVAARLTMRGVEPYPPPHWKVRVVFGGSGTLHLASSTEPRIGALLTSGYPKIEADWLSDPQCGDSIGFIDWNEVSAVTWRFRVQGPRH